MGNSALALGPAGIRFAPVAELLEDGLQGPSCGRERVDGTRGKVRDDFAFDDGCLLEPAKFLGQGLGRNRYQCTLKLIEMKGVLGKLPKYLERPFVTQKVEGGFHGTLGGDGWDFCHAELAFLHKGIEKYSC